MCEYQRQTDSLVDLATRTVGLEKYVTKYLDRKEAGLRFLLSHLKKKKLVKEEERSVSKQVYSEPQ